MKKWIIIFILVMGGGSSLFATRTLETKHFFIHYPDSLAETKVLEIGGYAEGAYAQLRKVFPNDIESVHIDVRTDVDMPNGNALTIMFNKIVIYITAPDYDEEAGFSHWIKNLLIHELTHIFELDATRGYASVLRSIFGKPGLPAAPFTTPNYTNPFWFHEGMAVLYETLYTEDGRLNSNEYASIFRKSAIYDNFPGISRITSYFSDPEFPHGNSPYIFGAGIFGHLFTELGKEPKIGGELAYIHGGRFYYWFNYGLETYSKIEDDNYSDRYEAFIAKEIQWQKNQLNILSQVPFTNPRVRLKLGERTVLAMTMDPAERNIYMITSSTDSRNALLRYELGTGALSTVYTAKMLDNRLRFDSTGKYLYFNVFEQMNSSVYSVPYQMRVVSGDVEKVADNLYRFKDLALSPGDALIVGRSMDFQGEKHLEIFNRATGKKERLIEKFSGINPLFISEEEILFFEYREKKTLFKKINHKTKTQTLLYTLDGKGKNFHLQNGTLYFSADSNGVFNAYSYRLSDGKLEILSHVDTAATFPLPGGSKLFFLYLHKENLVVAELDRQNLNLATLPKIENQRITPEPYMPGKDFKYSVADYAPFDYLNLYWWMPFVQGYGDEIYWGGMTSWSDPLYDHNFFLAFNVDVENKNPQGFFSYSTASDEGIFFLMSASRMISVYHNAPLDPMGVTDYQQSEILASFFTGYSYLSSNYGLSFMAGGVYQYWNGLDKPDNLAYGLFEGHFYGVGGAIVYSNKDYFLKSIRPLNGIYVAALGTYYVEPVMQEAGLDISISLELFPKNTVLTSTHNIRGIWGEKFPQSYYTLGGMSPFTFENQAFLRGYQSEELQGFYYVMGSLELSIPLFSTYGGWGNRPLFMKGMYLTLFYDYAQTAQNSFSEMDAISFYISFGGEITLSGLLFYVAPVDFILGIAHPYTVAMEPGRDQYQIYWALKIPLGIPNSLSQDVSRKKNYQYLRGY